ncbi:riboflavin biosynthesis protein RibF [Virgibacillus sp. MSP4-1]|uniref:riboflavin biosynthesis protein RibF n=1 Tax=Virgibacillus sp. MSP4-1 TaxID=2700081 RepID=UPI0003A3D1AA|nr:riboflavin biosynthesis protein RibF [Virgibacillus sp. MSP4-1]QHS22293.1 riboflavin biosynthesis protein RibF [Virgibacillus sp. MSP4-1]
MEVFELEYPIDKSLDVKDMSLAIGYFDGVHLGHQKVIGEAKKAAEEKDLKSAVMTFHPHPSVVLNKEIQEVHYLTPKRAKLEQFENLGIDYVFIVKFNESLAQLEPDNFAEEFLIKLGVKHLVAGFDFTYGHKGKGNMDTMKEHSKGEFTLSMIEKVSHNNEKISSTAIRNKIAEGRMDDAHHLLGRPYRLKGRVEKGSQRGHTIGFPTANIQLSDNYYLPRVGVYAVQFALNGSTYYGMANLGYKPTFQEDDAKPSLEVYIFDFSGNIYGKEAEVDFFTYIREEQKFFGIEELKSQLRHDEEMIRQFFAISS